MADIELIVKISEATYKKLKWLCESDIGIDSPIDRAIANGTPLTESDDCVSRQAVLHKAYKYGLYGFMGDIEDIEQFPPVYPQVQSRRLKHALEIIDKYRKGQTDADSD